MWSSLLSGNKDWMNAVNMLLVQMFRNACTNTNWGNVTLTCCISRLRTVTYIIKTNNFRVVSNIQIKKFPIKVLVQENFRCWGITVKHQLLITHVKVLLQLHLHSRLNNWLQWIEQRQLQDGTINIQVLGLASSYTTCLTVVLLQRHVMHNAETTLSSAAKYNSCFLLVSMHGRGLTSPKTIVYFILALSN